MQPCKRRTHPAVLSGGSHNPGGSGSARVRVSRRLVPSGFPSSGQAINCAVDADQTSISQSFFRDGGSDFSFPIVELLNTRITRNPVRRYFSSVSSPPDIDLNSRVEGCREISICLRENLPCKLAGCRSDLKTPHITLGRAIMRRPKPCLLISDKCFVTPNARPIFVFTALSR